MLYFDQNVFVLFIKVKMKIFINQVLMFSNFNCKS